MHLKRDSKLLAKANEPEYYVMIYHNTPVLFWDKHTDRVVFKHNQWETRATAAAMNYALEDIGVEARVRLCHGSLELINTRISERLTSPGGFDYRDLEVAS